MCDDFIHQGLTHDPTVSRRAFVVSSAASVVLSSASAAAQAKGRGLRGTSAESVLPQREGADSGWVI